MASRPATEHYVDKIRDELKADIRAVGVVVERIESQVRLVAETVVATRDEFDRKLTAVEQRLSARITTLEQVVRQQSAETQALRLEVAELRLRFDRRDLRSTSSRRASPRWRSASAWGDPTAGPVPAHGPKCHPREHARARISRWMRAAHAMLKPATTDALVARARLLHPSPPRRAHPSDAALARDALIAREALPEDNRGVCLDVILSALDDTVRKAVEMNGFDLSKYSPNDPFVKRFRLYVRMRRDEGLAEGVVVVLEARGIRLSEAQRIRILACQDHATLKRWITRAARAERARLVFEARTRTPSARAKPTATPARRGARRRTSA